MKFLIYFDIEFNVIFYTTAFALLLHYCGPKSRTDLSMVFWSHQCVVDAQHLGTVQASFNNTIMWWARRDEVKDTAPNFFPNVVPLTTF